VGRSQRKGFTGRCPDKYYPIKKRDLRGWWGFTEGGKSKFKGVCGGWAIRTFIVPSPKGSKEKFG